MGDKRDSFHSPQTNLGVVVGVTRHTGANAHEKYHEEGNCGTVDTSATTAAPAATTLSRECSSTTLVTSVTLLDEFHSHRGKRPATRPDHVVRQFDLSVRGTGAMECDGERLLGPDYQIAALSKLSRERESQRGIGCSDCWRANRDVGRECWVCGLILKEHQKIGLGPRHALQRVALAETLLHYACCYNEQLRLIFILLQRPEPEPRIRRSRDLHRWAICKVHSDCGLVTTSRADSA
mmetsp:Transcript_36144/g.82384  ORF Transcript_36144/g.82384 Transcript_36144/m.82384 type:complete len:237 (+) Transcript_36144:186-896(+)